MIISFHLDVLERYLFRVVVTVKVGYWHKTKNEGHVIMVDEMMGNTDTVLHFIEKNSKAHLVKGI